jgi:hypothetical protein
MKGGNEMKKLIITALVLAAVVASAIAKYPW